MRTASIIGGICVAAIALGCLLYFFGPPTLQSEVNSALQSSADSSAFQSNTPGAVSFKILAQGTDAVSISDRTNYRIDSGSDLQQLWPLIYGSKDMPTIPSIDFSRYEILAVFDGTHSSDGYSVAVKNITDQNATRTVVITHTAPGTSCNVSSTITSPYVLIQVPKTSFLLAHQDEAVTNSCSGQ